jgi:hypothetical protein
MQNNFFALIVKLQPQHLMVSVIHSTPHITFMYLLQLPDYTIGDMVPSISFAWACFFDCPLPEPSDAHWPCRLRGRPAASSLTAFFNSLCPYQGPQGCIKVLKVGGGGDSITPVCNINLYLIERTHRKCWHRCFGPQRKKRGWGIHPPSYASAYDLLTCHHSS